MAEKQITFDSGQFDQVITALTTVIDGLTAGTTTGSVPLSRDVRLQPDGQNWTPAIDLVAAGKTYFTNLNNNVVSMLPYLTSVRDAMISAKSIFQDTEDLATMSRADFVRAFPALDTAAPARLPQPW